MKEIQLRNIAAICACFLILVVSASVYMDSSPDGRAEANGSMDSTSTELYGDTESGFAEGIIGDIASDNDIIDDNTAEAVIDVQTVGQTYVQVSEGVPLADTARWEELSPEFTGAAQLVIPALADGNVISVEDDYMNRSVKIVIDNCLSGEFDISQFQRVVQGMYYIGEPLKEQQGDVVKKVEIVSKASEVYAGSSCIEINVKLDHIYACELHEYSDICCIDLKRPQDVYDSIIVIDAGHGGIDIGCNSTDGKYYEKNITLDMVKRLKKKLDMTNIKVYYTRLDDDSLALRQRVGLANELEADMFISLHCNYYDHYWIEGVDGVETLYSSVNKSNKLHSKQLALDMLDCVVEATGMRKRNAVNRKKELHILRNSKVPTIIVETGYMSDKKDLKMMTGKKSVNKIVDGIYNGIIKSYADIYGKTIE